MRFLGNGFVFCIFYLVFMLPTYILPYAGSNSSIVAGLGAASGQGVNPATVWHLLALAALVVITWFRAALVGKQWLIVLPALAAVFDMIPPLSSIPLVPTILHLFVLIKGVSEKAA